MAIKRNVVKMKEFEKIKITDNKPALASDIAKSFGDLKNMPLYISYCKKYPSDIILKAFGQTKELPDSKIKKSRTALFTYLVKKYAQENNN